MTSSRDSRIRILLIGGGFAALEAMLALRALLGERAELLLVSAQTQLAYRPDATAEVFVDGGARGVATVAALGARRRATDEYGHIGRSYDLRAICADLGVTFRRDRLEALASKHHRVRLASFAHLDYDILILALGARATVAVPGALTFRDQRDVPQLRRVLAEMRAGEIRRTLFTVPSGCTWPLALYELALMTAFDAERHGVRTEVTLVSPENEPLELFGHEASMLAARVLADRGVRFHGGSIPASVAAGGGLTLHFDGSVAADRVISAPQLRGPRVSGLPSDWWGFVATDTRGRVEGLSDVYAAGDMTSFPVKQGGLAAQQADAIAEDIAARHGLAVPDPLPPTRMVRARLLGGVQPLMLEITLDERGRALASSLRGDVPGLAAAPGVKVFGRYLTPYLLGLESLAAAS